MAAIADERRAGLAAIERLNARYDALLTNSNALVEAVHGLLGSLSNGEFKPTVATDGHVVRIAAQRMYEINRAEVDRLIGGE